MKYQVDFHSFDTEQGVESYLNKRAQNGWKLHSVTPTNRSKDGIRPILMYVWERQ